MIVGHDGASALRVTPVPDDTEAAAIVAAYEALWPKPLLAEQRGPRTTPAWRFSGRWWASPLPLRRGRPH